MNLVSDLYDLYDLYDLVASMCLLYCLNVAAISLDRPGVNRRGGGGGGGSAQASSGRPATAGDRSTTRDLGTRPRMPIPRTNSQSGVDRIRPGSTTPGSSNVNLSSSLPQPPPPLPSRRTRYVREKWGGRGMHQVCGVGRGMHQV